MTIILPTKDFPKNITKEFLDGYVGYKVEDFCGSFGTTGDEHNHCAHFVSHVLGFRIGQLCNSMKFETRKDVESGRTMREMIYLIIAPSVDIGKISQRI